MKLANFGCYRARSARRLRDGQQWPKARPSFFERSEKKRRAERIVSCETARPARRAGQPQILLLQKCLRLFQNELTNANGIA